ncbi:hypothetical protein HY572_03990 [Candidatus Micrarchaeota archaeon]|nr:hypothetical protein [Candidatus Micrarchaeota archaeon]
MRGFLLTLDALFALAILIAGLSFFAVQSFSEPAAASALYLVGRDFLVLPPGLQPELADSLEPRGFTVSSQPPNSRFVVQAKAFRYVRACEGAVSPDAGCLRETDAAFSSIQSVTWVGVR